jgi:hypothetical protein
MTESRLNGQLCDEILFNNDFTINRIRVLSCATVDAPCVPLSQNPLTHAREYSITQSHTRSLDVSRRPSQSASGKRVGSGPGTTRWWDAVVGRATSSDMLRDRTRHFSTWAVDATLRRKRGETELGDYLGAETGTTIVQPMLVRCSSVVLWVSDSSETGD